MSEIDTLMTEIIAEAEARHKEKATEYYDTLRRISAICDEHEGDVLQVIRMIANRAMSH